MFAFARTERDRRPDLSSSAGKSETARHDPNDGVGLVAQLDRLADRIRVAGETAFPKFVTEDDDRVGAVSIFLGSEIAPERRLNAQQLKEIERNARADKPLRFIRPGQVESLADVGRDMLEDLVLGSPLEEIRGRARRLGKSRLDAEDADDLFRLRIRQRPKQNRVDHTEDRGVRADGESQSEDRDECKGR
jgi:hypothetical protein